jgi:hypothetical protein
VPCTAARLRSRKTVAQIAQIRATRFIANLISISPKWMDHTPCNAHREAETGQRGLRVVEWFSPLKKPPKTGAAVTGDSGSGSPSRGLGSDKSAAGES